MFMHMLGYPTHFGQMETLKLVASNGFADKVCCTLSPLFSAMHVTAGFVAFAEGGVSWVDALA